MKTVVIIDDEKDIVTILSDILMEVDVNVVGVAYDGKTGIEMVRHHEPDFLFVDLMMPENNGFYVIENVRKFNTKTQIVPITGDISNETQHKLKTYGITDILHKPVDFDYLIKLVST